MDSCIFEGKVVHTRAEPIAHSFNYRIFMMFLKLNEIDKIFDRYFLWGTGKYSFARFRRSDHIGPEEIPIDAHIRGLVFKETKKTIKGDIFVGWAVGDISGSGTIDIQSAIDPENTCVGEFRYTSTWSLVGKGTVSCKDGSQGTFNFKGLTNLKITILIQT